MRTQRFHARTANAPGYTAIEVLLSMTVLAIGAAGVISMQKAAIQGNNDARQLDTANAIAHTWMDRLRTDATAWTLPSTLVASSGTSNLVNTQWLNHALSVFFLPTAPATYPAEGYSAAFDNLGRDLDATDAPTAVFCTHIKLEALYYDQAANPLILNATVLVFWPKALLTSASPSASNCTTVFDVAAYEAAHPGTYHLVYLTSAIRKNPLQ